MWRHCKYIMQNICVNIVHSSFGFFATSVTFLLKFFFFTLSSRVLLFVYNKVMKTCYNFVMLQCFSYQGNTRVQFVSYLKLILFQPPFIIYRERPLLSANIIQIFTIKFIFIDKFHCKTEIWKSPCKRTAVKISGFNSQRSKVKWAFNSDIIYYYIPFKGFPTLIVERSPTLIVDYQHFTIMTISYDFQYCKIWLCMFKFSV